MREGSLDAPTRHPIQWEDPAFTDEAALDAETRRVFDICHGCRRCFNLCDSFPRLFDLIDATESGELDQVKSEAFAPVIEACTLCDMCFLTKCPYVPPHDFNLDFPHLMLRHRAVELRKGKVSKTAQALTATDRNGVMGMLGSSLANWATAEGNRLTRPLMERMVGIHRDAALPRYSGRTFVVQTAQEPPVLEETAPAFGRKAVIYPTCFVNYNSPSIGMAARAVLARNGVETEVLYPRCCGMPQLEHGDLAKVAQAARRVAAEFRPYVDRGLDVIALVPSCALMMKFEWPLIVPDDDNVKALAKATFDISEYLVDIARKEGLAEGMAPIEGGVTVHIACHARAQNMGQKAAELLRQIPSTRVAVIERCSGHGGSWGIMKESFETALKVGKPVARQALKNKTGHVSSECPLAGLHIIQGMERVAAETGDTSAVVPKAAPHPVELIARAYGLAV